MKVEQLDINSVKPYGNNPRKNEKAVDVVANSIQQYGFQQPIVVDKDMSIIVGHTRYRAAKKLGLQTIPVSIADTLTPEQVSAYRIMDNRSNENAKWDEDKLIDELKTLLTDTNIQELSFETGFTESELNKMFPDPTEDILEKYREGDTAKSKVGEIWLLGEHRLMCGDSTKVEDYQALLGTEQIDMLWEDPPYGVAYETANGINYTKEENELRNHKIKNDNLTPEQLDAFLQAHLVALTPRVKVGASIYWAHDIRFTQQFRDLLETSKYHISDTLIWKKNNASNWLSNYAKYYEPILYGWKLGAEHRWFGKGMCPNTIDLDKLEDYTKEQLIKVIESIDRNYQEFSKEPRKIASIHPTVKPVKLIMYHIINSSKPGEIVFDGFNGSGSTLIACERTGRTYRGIEIEPKFVDATIKRWQEETGLKAVRQGDNVEWDNLNNIAGNTELQDAFFNGLNKDTSNGI
jgi:ParB/RepB/Spo0J family partition protein